MNIFLGFLVFVAVFFAIAGLYSVLMDLFLRDKSKLEDRIRSEFRNKQRQRAEQKKGSLFKDLGDMAGGISSQSIMERIQTFIEQAGLDWTAQVLVLSCFLCAAAFGALGTVAFMALSPTLSIAFGFFGMLFGAVAPFLVVRVKQQQRISLMRSQLPDTFDMMARVIRAGQTMTQAMQAVADEFAPPIAIEFALCHEMMNLGIPDAIALQDMARRSGIMELKIFVMGLMIQKEVGGNLAELLDNLAKVVRDRFRINGIIKALTAEGRMQAAVLLALPPAMLIAMLVLNPVYAQTLIDMPIMLVMLFVSEFFGWLWIRQIVNFDF